jgi:polyvinyl alcohol dehydrogenase (cytochrome)
MALDLKTERIVWSTRLLKDYNSSCGAKGVNCPEESGPDYDFGASAMLVTTPSGRDVLVAGQKSGVVYAVDRSQASSSGRRASEGWDQWRRGMGHGERWTQCLCGGVRFGADCRQHA